MTKATTLPAAEALVAAMTNQERANMLTALTAWADSEEGCEHRAGLAHDRTPSPYTAEDVLSLLPDEQAAEVRELMANLG